MSDILERLRGLYSRTGHEAAAEIARLRAINAELLAALEDAQRVIEKHGFGGTDQNPFGIHDIIGAAIIAAKGAQT